MKLSKLALQRIAENPGVRLDLAKALGCTEASIRRHIRQNDKGNTDLTKAASLAVLRKTFGLTDEEILEAETINA